MLPGDYGHAVIHLAFRGGKKIAPPRALFGLVELLPAEFPEPVREVPPPFSIGSGDGGIVRVLRFPYSASVALRWFEEVGRTFSEFPAEKRPGQALSITAPLLEPEGPGWLTLDSDGTHSTPYIPACHDSARVRFRLDPAFTGLSDLRPERQAEVHAYLRKTLLFRVEEHSELLGGLVLVAPNPVFGALRVRYQPDSNVVRIAASPRAGQSLERLSLVIRNERHNGLCQVVTRPFAAVNEVAFENPIGMVSFTVECSERGVLYIQKPTTFINTIQLGTKMITQTRQVVVKHGTPDGAEEDQVEVASYRVPVGVTERSEIGAREPETARQRLHLASLAREEASKHRRADFHMFFEDADGAAEALRARIARAERRLLIVDAYFGAEEVYTFALAASEANLPVRVLTWAGHLKQRLAQRTRRAERLLEAVDKVEGKSGIGSLTVQVYGGQRARIHDRFLIVDDAVWLLGSSLNSFGTAATMLVRLPSSSAVLDLLSEIDRDLVPLDEWVAAHPPPAQPGLVPRLLKAIRRFIMELRG